MPLAKDLRQAHGFQHFGAEHAAVADFNELSKLLARSTLAHDRAKAKKEKEKGKKKGKRKKREQKGAKSIKLTVRKDFHAWLSVCHHDTTSWLMHISTSANNATFKTPKTHKGCKHICT